MKKESSFRLILLLLLCFNIIQAKECSPYYNPKKFYEASEGLTEILDENFSNGIFSDISFKDKVAVHEEVLKKGSFIKFGEYIYPTKNGLWKYKKIDNKINEVNISRTEIYKLADIEIANSINDDLDNFWDDFIENAYEMQLTPEQTLFRYNNTYFTMAVFIYGVKGDQTPLKGTSINLWLKDYTKEVNIYIKCMKEKNDS
jgi:hypothetical protein